MDKEIDGVKEVKSSIKDWMKKRSIFRKAEKHAKALDSNEEPFDPEDDRPNEEWWKQNWDMPETLSDEENFDWWSIRGKPVLFHLKSSQLSSLVGLTEDFNRNEEVSPLTVYNEHGLPRTVGILRMMAYSTWRSSEVVWIYAPPEF